MQSAALSSFLAEQILPKVYPVIVRPLRDWHFESVETNFGLERVERRCSEKHRSRVRSTYQRQSVDHPPCTHGPRL
jgi:hypothetical protein